MPLAPSSLSDHSVVRPAAPARRRHFVVLCTLALANLAACASSSNLPAGDLSQCQLAFSQFEQSALALGATEFVWTFGECPETARLDIDGEVLAILDRPNRNSVEVRGNQEGSATVVLRDGDTALDTLSVRVARAVDVILEDPTVGLSLNFIPRATELSVLRVARGPDPSFLLRYVDEGGNPLIGGGLVEASGPVTLVSGTFDQMRVNAATAGEFTVNLSFGGVAVRSFSLFVLERVAMVELEEDSAWGLRALRAVGRTAAGEVVRGVPSWRVNGAPFDTSSSSGIRFDFDVSSFRFGDDTVEVEATLGGERASWILSDVNASP
ncbi:MAG: hypothetical protein AAF411_00120 [Myxococcota bacterium]